MSMVRTPDKIRILVVDDHPVVRYGVASLFGTQSDLEVIGEAETSQQCCELVKARHPDVVLLDLELGDACGCAALACLREARPATRTIVFTGHDEEWRVMKVVELGVEGYLVKGSPFEQLIEAVRVVGRGGVFLGPGVSSKLMQHVAHNHQRHSTHNRELSEREKTILTMVAQGRRNKEISKVLSITERTVKFHVSGVLSKLSATNRTEAARIALSSGLITL